MPFPTLIPTCLLADINARFTSTSFTTRFRTLRALFFRAYTSTAPIFSSVLASSPSPSWQRFDITIRTFAYKSSTGPCIWPAMSSGQESSLSLKEMHDSSSSTSSLVAGRPKTVLFHGGIGGAGNYRTVARIEEPDSTPTPHPRLTRRSHFSRPFGVLFSSGIGGAGNMHTRGEEAALTEIEGEARARARDTHAPKRWFVGIGGIGNKRTRRQQSPCSDVSETTGSTQYSTEALPYGAAEIMRRKLLGDRANEGRSSRITK